MKKNKFGTYFKQSWLAIISIFVGPLIACALYMFVLDPDGILFTRPNIDDEIVLEEILDEEILEATEDETIDIIEEEELLLEEDEFFPEDGAFGFSIAAYIPGLCIGISMILLNFIFLLVVPCFGKPEEKKQNMVFAIGLVTNLALTIGLPCLAWLLFHNYNVELLTALALLGLCCLGFVLAFLTGACFVAPVYRNAFNRRNPLYLVFFHKKEWG